MKEKIINIVEDFSEMPYGSTDEHGPANGTAFRKMLMDAMKENDVVKVDYKGLVFLPGSTFLDEAFGALTRVEGYTQSYLNEHLQIINSSECSKKTIEREIANGVEERRTGKRIPAL